MKQYGFYFDSAKCTGCKTCIVSCADEKDLSLGVKFRRVYEYGGGSWAKEGKSWRQNVFSYWVSISCNHCSDPTCLYGCPTKALQKREADGLVVIDEDRCVGCRYCEMRCPYAAPRFDAKKRVMTKCDGCYERVEQKLKPVCVESCPQRALDFDLIENLAVKYGRENSVAPLPIGTLTYPNLIVKPHRDSKPSGDRTGKIQNVWEV